MPASDFVNPPYFLPTLLSSQSNFVENALLSSRLAEFVTGSTEPLSQHRVWLSNDVANLIKSTPGSWVALWGHASLAGNPQDNFTLSRGRIEAVENILKSALAGTTFKSYTDIPRGVSDSGGSGYDNGAFRSVEVFVYGPEVQPQVKLTEVLKRKITFLRIEKITDHMPGHDGDKFDKLGKLTGDSIIHGIIDGARLSNQRIVDHPAERDFPDLGKVQNSVTDKITEDEVLIAIDIDTSIEKHRVERIIHTADIVEIKHEYRYIYAPGPSGKSVAVHRKINGVFSPTFEIPQPHNLMDP